jgi:hypothetical protein
VIRRDSRTSTSALTLVKVGALSFSLSKNVAVKNYIPSIERISVEVLATMCGVLGAAFLISRFPTLKGFVDGNTVWAMTQPPPGT